ncbi:MAG: Uncharacterized protein G01um101493_70 [Microgenomates group bacterium Gr01-1014_93]|nr:MAG: Uncharacterized protein G01um101493_70 [Microgenomates group bacterium Gr01-1014_93]
MKARLIDISHPKHAQTMAQIMLNGGIVGAIWGHHLYFLACNACNLKAVARMNGIKNRPKNQVFVSPGAVEEAQEFGDFEKSKALIWASRKLNLAPIKYLEFLFKKFPLGVELIANGKAPSSVTFTTKKGKTIWIAAHMGDKNYSKFLDEVRSLRKSGKKIIFAGTSLNLRGDNTLTVKDFDKVMEDFGDKVDGLSVHSRGGSLKKLRFSTSCSVVSFIHDKPKLLRVGCTKHKTLQKYIPGLEINDNLLYTRK